jgi:hypothetical protein
MSSVVKSYRNSLLGGGLGGRMARREWHPANFLRV